MTISLTIDLESPTQTQKEILMKLSELAATVAAMNNQVSTIATDVAALKAGAGGVTDPELPADAATNIVALQTGLQSLADSVKPPTV